MKLELSKWGQGMGAKVALIAVLVGVLWGVLGLQNELVSERRSLRDEAVARTVGEWGGEQRFVGPFLRVPYRETIGRGADQHERDTFAYVLPEQFAVDSGLTTETRQRGLYQVPLYRAVVEVTGRFELGSDRGWFPLGARPQWDRAEVWYFLQSARGLDQRPLVTWNGEAQTSVRASSDTELDAFAFPVVLGSEPVVLPFRIALHVRGGASFGVFPAGRDSALSVRVDAGSPEFGGDYLPTTRDVGSAGFSAQWRVPSLARSIPSRGTAESWNAVLSNPPYASFDLAVAFDGYRLIDRALKYGLLFLVVPFVGLFLFEVFTRKRLHPVQYLLVGLAVSMFYLLLLSLSERVEFGWAFFAGATAVCALLTVYTQAVLRGTRDALLSAAGMAALYGLLYLIIVSEDNALLVGTFFLFTLLALVMVTTRRIDWYRLSRSA